MTGDGRGSRDASAGAAPALRVWARIPADLWPDLLFTGVALAGLYLWFLRRWPLWEDQSIYEYMAAGIPRGLRLYHDTINMNWPATILMHLLGRAFGAGGPGLRLVECMVLATLCVSTSVMLRAFRAHVLLRLLALAVFLSAYFHLGNINTAQRESFMIGFCSLALVPLALGLARGELGGDRVCMLGGAAAVMAIAVKPTAVLLLAPMAAATVVLWPSAKSGRARLWRGLAFYAAGAAGMLLAWVIFLAIFGDLRGFWRWCVGFAFGPYARVSYPRAVRLDLIKAHFAEHRLPLRALLALALLGAGAFLVSLVTGSLSSRAAAGNAGERPLVRAIVALSLVAAAFYSAYVQGKNHCAYHFIPLYWTLALSAGLLGANISLRREPAPTWARWGGTVLLLTALFFQFRHREDRVMPPHDLQLPTSLRAELGPDDTIVMFGFMPSLLCDLNLRRPTPFAFVDSWIMYAGSGKGTGFRRRILSNWRRALENPHTRFFLVHHNLNLGGLAPARVGGADGEDPPGYNREENSDEIVAQNFPDDWLAQLGYRLTTRIEGAGAFAVYERVR